MARAAERGASGGAVSPLNDGIASIAWPVLLFSPLRRAVGLLPRPLPHADTPHPTHTFLRPPLACVQPTQRIIPQQRQQRKRGKGKAAAPPFGFFATTTRSFFSPLRDAIAQIKPPPPPASECSHEARAQKRRKLASEPRRFVGYLGYAWPAPPPPAIFLSWPPHTTGLDMVVSS